MAEAAKIFGDVKLIDTDTLFKIEEDSTVRLIINKSTGALTLGSSDGTGSGALSCSSVTSDGIGSFTSVWVNASEGVPEVFYTEGDAKITGYVDLGGTIKAAGTTRLLIDSTGLTIGSVSQTGTGDLWAKELNSTNISIAGNASLSGTLSIKEGSDSIMGSDTVQAISGSVTVSTSAVTANSRIFLTSTNLPVGGGESFNLYVSAIDPSTSFTVSFAGNQQFDATFNWLIINPA